jgi:DNA-binding MarR family transcriptional regulator
MSKMKHPELLVRIRSVIQQAIYFEKGNRIEAGGVQLHPSEIHVLLLIGAGQGNNATRMAERLGITKGAVSQTLTRLERKGLLKKWRDPQAKNELTLLLTPPGSRAARKCQGLQTAIQRRFDAYLSSVSEAERKAIGRFMKEMSAILCEAR